jgi:tetratricopeptide (TPR) repeat protein
MIQMKHFKYLLIYLCVLIKISSIPFVEEQDFIKPDGSSQMDPFKKGLLIRAKQGPRGALTALSYYESALRQNPSSIEILDELAEVFDELKKYDKALAARKEALAIRVRKSGGSISIAEFVSSYAAIAQDLQHIGDYKQANEMLKKAIDALGPPSSVSSSSRSLLLRMKSNVFECSGSSLDALLSFETALDLSGIVGQKPRLKDMSNDDLLTYVWLLRRAISNESSSSSFSIIKQRESSVTRQLIKRGPWVRGDQLPKQLLPNLLSKPWHTVETFHGLDVVEKLLERYAPLLMNDLINIQRLGYMLNETECINDSVLGKWTWFATNGFWLPNKVDGCSSKETPHACLLLSEVSKIQIKSSRLHLFDNAKEEEKEFKLLRVVRGSFSVLGPYAHLHPHCGTTNTQLKMHVGLDIPLHPTTGVSCAFLKVGNETRTWIQNKVLFFDDSYAHEVRNECNAERSVFQLVFEHPDLTLPLTNVITSH